MARTAFSKQSSMQTVFYLHIFVLTMCFEAVYNIKELSNKQIGTSLWISIGLLVLFEQLFMAEGSTYSFKIAYVSGIFILLYALLIFINNNAKLKIPLVLLLTFSVSIIECTLNMDSTGIGTTSRTSYLLDYDAVKTVTKTVADNDDSFTVWTSFLVQEPKMMVHGIITKLYPHFLLHVMQVCQNYSIILV